MAYDDDGSIYNFRDIEDLIAILDSYFSAGQNLTVIRVIVLTQALHEILAGRSAEHMDLGELAGALRQRGLATVSFDVVVRVLNSVARVPSGDDVLAGVTLRDLQEVIRR